MSRGTRKTPRNRPRSSSSNQEYERNNELNPNQQRSRQAALSCEVLFPAIESGNTILPDVAFRQSLRPSSQGGKYLPPNMNSAIDNTILPVFFQVTKTPPLPVRTDFYHLLVSPDGSRNQNDDSVADILRKSSMFRKEKEFISFSQKYNITAQHLIQNQSINCAEEDRIVHTRAPRIARTAKREQEERKLVEALKAQMKLESMRPRTTGSSGAPSITTVLTNSETTMSAGNITRKTDSRTPSHSTQRVEKMKILRKQRREELEENTLTFLTDKKLVEKVQAATEWKRCSERRWDVMVAVVQIVHPTAQRLKTVKPKRKLKTTLYDVLVDAAPFFWITKRELSRVFVDTYAYNVATRRRFSRLMSLLFVALDDKLTGVIDWRDIVSMLKVVESPNIHISKKLHWMFDLYAKPCSAPGDASIKLGEPVLDLYSVWKIAQVSSLEDEKEEVLSLLLLGLRKVWGKPSQKMQNGRKHSNNSDTPAISQKEKLIRKIIHSERTKNIHGEEKLKEGDSIQDQFIRLKLLYNGRVLNREDFHKVFIRWGVAGGLVSGTAMDYHKQFQEEGSEQSATLQALDQDDADEIDLDEYHIESNGKNNYTTKHKKQGKVSGLYELYCNQFWNRLPESTRLEITVEGQSKASEQFQALDQRLRMQQAVDFFRSVMVPSYLKDRFELWKLYVEQQRMKYKAERHWELRSKRVGFCVMEMWIEGRLLRREQNKLAAEVYSLRLVLQQFASWKQFAVVEGADHRAAKARATALHHRHLVRRHLSQWRREAKEQQKWKMAVEHFDRRLTQAVLRAWQGAATNLVYEKKEAERKGRMRQTIVLHDMEENKKRAAALRKQQEEDDRLAAEEAARAEALRKKKAEQAEQQRLIAMQKMEADKKLLMQREEKRRHKREKREMERQVFLQVWEGITKKAVQEARREAEAFLATSQGAKQILREIKLIQDDVELMSSNSNEQGMEMDSADATWTKIFDPRFNEYFFYNRETGEKKEPNLLTKKECQSIACSQYIARQVEAARNDVTVMQKREEEQVALERSAQIVQGMWRSRLAKQVIQKMMRMVYVKRTDPETGKCYYYNRSTKQSSWTKPLSLGSSDLPQPEWVVRVKVVPGQEPVQYYENRLSPWLSIGEKPAGILPCTICRTQLASDWCGKCVEYYCLDCFENAHAKIKAKSGPTEVIKHEETHRAVDTVPVKCRMCTLADAVCICQECEWTASCSKCFDLVHKNHFERKTHQRIMI